MKIEGSGSASGSISQRGMDPRIRIRIHTKMSWIRNTGSGDGIIYSESGPLSSASASSPTLLSPVLWIRVRIRTESAWIWLSRDADPYWNSSGSRSKEICHHVLTNLISSLSKRRLYCTYVPRRNTYLVPTYSMFV
jgi:hypothetical protein